MKYSRMVIFFVFFLSSAFVAAQNPETKVWTWEIKDALGNPLLESDFDVYSWEPTGSKTFREHIKSNGIFKSDQSPMPFLEYIFSHPDYGKAVVRHICADDVLHTDYYLPLVKNDSDAADRAIGGRVIDANGNPIENTRIYCTYIETPGSGGAYPKQWSDKIAVITDKDGYFQLYMPIGQTTSLQQNDLIPFNSLFQIRIEPPENSNFLPYDGRIANAKDVEITLEKKSGRKHNLLFMKDKYTPFDPNILSYADIRIERPSQQTIRLKYKQLMEMQQLPYGTYYVQIIGWSAIFDPVEINANSPETIIFSLPAKVTYKGRVINGITGDPIRGAYILLNAVEVQTGRLSKQDWTQLNRLSSHPNSKQALNIIQKVYVASEAAATDYDGYYTFVKIPNPTDRPDYVIQQDFMLAEIPRNSSNSQPIEGKPVYLEDIKLFPSAIVVADFRWEKSLIVNPKWRFVEETKPQWADDMKYRISSTKWKKTDEHGYIRNTWSMEIPAQADIKVFYEPSLEDSKTLAPRYINNIINLAQGEIFSLGSISLPAIEKAMVQITLKVLDSKNLPLDGVPVRIAGDLPVNTDANGVAHFYVPKRTASYFNLRCFVQRNNPPIEHRLDFSIEDPNNPKDYQIIVSNEFVNCIYDPNSFNP
ncbi:MAG: hypothetical protein A2Y10_02950 [Planctomycetes bacterium GWF2_41_51]|nr:MAG: hypothetical protein A2Y10_02950 [Planctomycetes bacterium GWF2_41_51]HBG27509.1 hypothetical protein [Phycisphaerales bacterium]